MNREQRSFGFYSVEDVSFSYRTGWWSGFAIGAMIMLGVCTLIGLFLPV